jgi:hypothetical protein
VVLSFLSVLGPKLLVPCHDILSSRTGLVKVNDKAFACGPLTVPLQITPGNREILNRRPIVFSRFDLQLTFAGCHAEARWSLRAFDRWLGVCRLDS